jgi:hypothetical protein
METAVPGSGACSHAGLADLHGRELRQGRGALRSIIPSEHAGIFSNVVEACAAVLPSELLQLSFGALLKMDTVFADRRASEPSVARRATGPAWAHCCAPRQRACGFMEHGCGQALSAPVHEEGVGGERSALQGSAGQWLGAACEQHASLHRAAMWAASAREHSLM